MSFSIFNSNPRTFVVAFLLLLAATAGFALFARHAFTATGDLVAETKAVEMQRASPAPCIYSDYGKGNEDYYKLTLYKAAKPDIVYVASYPPDSAGILRAVNEIGVGDNVKLFGGGMVGLQFGSVMENLGSLLNGVVVRRDRGADATGERRGSARGRGLRAYRTPRNASRRRTRRRPWRPWREGAA